MVVLLALCSALGASEAAREDSTQQPGQPAVQGQDNPTGAIGQTIDAVHWVGRRRKFTLEGSPYGFTGLPILYFSPYTGWNYGARLQWSDLRRRPYRYKLILHWARSTEGKIKYLAIAKVPRISGTGFGVFLQLSLERDMRTRYYGFGNDSVYHRKYTDPQSPSFRDEDYYYYVLERPRGIFRLLRQLRGPLSMSAGFGVERAQVSRHGERSYYAEEGTPDGVVDGVTGFASLTLQWDSRDDETLPRRGVFHEWSYETSRNSLLGLFFAQINYRRYTVTDARYWPLSDRLTLAQRTIFETLKGAVPLYAYGEIGGSRRIKGLGGGDSLRGFDSQRFTDNLRFISNSELRYHLRSSRVARQHLEWQGALFMDAGRVWPALDKLTLNDMHLTAGAGARLFWNADFVIRLDVGFSSEQPYVTLKYRNIF